MTKTLTKDNLHLTNPSTKLGTMAKKYNLLDLFSGCGGLSKGFEQTGQINVLAGVDHDTDSLVSFSKNHKNARGLKIDLFDENFADEIKQQIKDAPVDIIVGGPPCQGFSLTGPRNFDDKRNTLYLAMIKAVEEFQPKAFVIENVPGLATMYNGKVKDEIIERFTDMGYKVKHKILLAADYGVPQKRRRVFFVGVRSNFDDFEFPNAMFHEGTYISASDAISDLPSRNEDPGLEADVYTSKPKTEYQKKMRANSKKLTNHVATVHTQKIVDVISQVPDGGNYKSLPKGVGEHRKFNEAWTRYNSKLPSRTIDTGHRNHFHYKWNRIPTVRENARLQSFPDDFVFSGSRTSQHRQVGNAVPPLLGQAVAQQILKALSND